jgi:carboxylesterase type B
LQNKLLDNINTIFYLEDSVVKTMWWFQLLLLIVLKCVSNAQVTTPSGKIEGSTLTSRLGKTIYSFRGIRYAKAPISELRFKPPVPVQNWSGTYNATADGPLCPQPGVNPVSEDCLFLNVYTTQLPDGTNNPKRPVIVHIHAGGFYAFGGRSDWVGPRYLMDQEIVLVTINYRLGALGFLSLGKESPGNYGLKDQVVALRWIQKNIEAFGGDPGSVTLYGYSAGAWSISLHMVATMSRGLFHKAILGGGSALGQWRLPYTQLDLAKKQARFVGCPDTTPKEIIDCLKTVPAETLGNTLFQFREFASNPVLIWSPVVERDYGQDPFLDQSPVRLFRDGNFQKIPVMAGITKDEFVSLAVELIQNKTLLKQFNDDFEKYAPINFFYERGTERSKEISRCLREFYLGEEPLSNASFSGLSKVYKDIVGFQSDRAVELISKKCSKPVYYYEITYQGRYSTYYRPGTNDTVPYGVAHNDELLYLFDIPVGFPFFGPNFPERKMVEKMTSMWAQFAKTGNPTTAGDVHWEPYNIHTKKYMDIGEKLVLKNNLSEERYALWRKLFPVSGY